MNLPLSVKKVFNSNTIIPFPPRVEAALTKEDASRPSWLEHISHHLPQTGKKLAARKIKNTNIIKLYRKPSWEFSRNFFETKKKDRSRNA